VNMYAIYSFEPTYSNITFSFTKFLSQELILHGCMFGLCMHEWLLGDVDGTCIVTIDRYRLIKFNFNILQCLYNP
jgi:hypothetical protein